MKENSEVLALKYRPNSFEELIGQEAISQTLSLALDSKRLSHAYLFSGLRGSGKTSTARIFAKALICDRGPTSNPCGSCEHCMMAEQNRHIDIIEMDAASNRGIDDIRELVEQTKYKPASAGYKIFIIDEVHMLTPPAFNALLKTLEEPPEYVKFILATTDPLKLPATILSRTQHFRFKRIAPLKVVHHLSHILHLENIEYEPQALEILARSGNGSLRDTLTLLDQAIIYSKNFVDVKTVTDMLGLVDPNFITEIFKAVFAKDYASLVEFTKVLEEYEAEMVVDELVSYLKERMFANDPLFSTLILDRFFRILNDSKSLFAINADGSFVLSLLFFKMVEALRVKEIDQMIESLQKEVKHLDVVKVPAPAQIADKYEDEEPLKQSPAEVPAVQEETSSEEKADDESLKKYEKLVANIMDRNIELGECFVRHIRFISFEEGVLTWESCVDEECKKALSRGFSVIKQLVREVFGFETVMKNLPCSRSEEQIVQNQPESQEEEESQPSSMVEESEVGTGSCVTNCSEGDESVKEFDGASILDEPMIQKATEMFEATKITVQSKI
ncbi:DNA polymerase III subunit gamma/tau [Sulfurimonas sp. HSL-1716]|uniref:DNA polymerase III subunit gamma/tau n=1 Tax=Hydrocurvibacter sulfurireducens TaxID=3131937 RepID=UPI0031F82495